MIPNVTITIQIFVKDFPFSGTVFIDGSLKLRRCVLFLEERRPTRGQIEYVKY